MTHPYPKRNFVPTAVATKSEQVLVNAGKQNSAASTSTARPKVNTAVIRPNVNAKSSYFKPHFPKRRHLTKDQQQKLITFSRKNNTAKGKNTQVNNGLGPKEKLILLIVVCKAIHNILYKIKGILIVDAPSNVVPLGDLTCLFAKATIDESNLWHRRLGHINFKTLNKLVRGNLFCQMKGIKKEFSVARTPQQNRVAERKNRTLIEVARTMLADSLLPTTFWAEAVNTAYHLGKFNGKTDKGFLVGYSVNSKAFRVFNSRTKKVEENLHVNFLENKPNVAESGPKWLFDIDSLTKSMNYELVSAGNQSNGDTCIQIDIHARQASQEKAAVHEYIMLPFISSTPPLSSTIQSLDINVGNQPGDVNAGDIQGDVEEISRNDDVFQGNEIKIDSSTHAVNAASTSINTAISPHSWPQVRKSSFAKPYPVNARGPSRNSPKHVTFQSPKESVGLNDMVHNYYLEEAKKKGTTPERQSFESKT
nr:hypothetical protein [Tanacetum cinerariifolium]